MIPAVKQSPEQIAQLKPETQKRRLKEACQEFESFLNGYVLKSMRQSISKAEEGDQANAMYEGMLDDMLAQEMSRSGKGSVADLLYRELLPLLDNSTPEKGSAPAGAAAPSAGAAAGSGESPSRAARSYAALSPGALNNPPQTPPLPQGDGSED